MLGGRDAFRGAMGERRPRGENSACTRRRDERARRPRRRSTPGVPSPTAARSSRVRARELRATTRERSRSPRARTRRRSSSWSPSRRRRRRAPGTCGASARPGRAHLRRHLQPVDRLGVAIIGGLCVASASRSWLNATRIRDPSRLAASSASAIAGGGSHAGVEVVDRDVDRRPGLRDERDQPVGDVGRRSARRLPGSRPRSPSLADDSFRPSRGRTCARSRRSPFASPPPGRRSRRPAAGRSGDQALASRSPRHHVELGRPVVAAEQHDREMTDHAGLDQRQRFVELVQCAEPSGEHDEPSAAFTNIVLRA